MPQPPLPSSSSRFALRLRRSVLRGYELALYALLLAMVLGVVLPPAPHEKDDDALQCGNIQSSPRVITR
jgi:hypothetical protein